MRFNHRRSPFDLLGIVLCVFVFIKTISFNISIKHHYNPLTVKVKPVPVTWI